LFVGGSDYHKLKESPVLIGEARRRGLWIHVGRVNSIRRMNMFESVDSVDGTSIAIEPSVRNIEKFLNHAKVINERKRSQLCLFPDMF
jgi:hypothetical protein